MNRPKLVNPKFTPKVQNPQKVVQNITIPIPISRKEWIRRRSLGLNIFVIIIFLISGYFIYTLYLEQRAYKEYISRQPPIVPVPRAGGNLMW